MTRKKTRLGSRDRGSVRVLVEMPRWAARRAIKIERLSDARCSLVGAAMTHLAPHVDARPSRGAWSQCDPRYSKAVVTVHNASCPWDGTDEDACRCEVVTLVLGPRA